MQLDAILERNREFVRDREPAPLSGPEEMPFGVVACFDPRLDSLLLPALGLSPGKAFVLRVPGAFLPPDSRPLRSLGLAVFMLGLTEVLVVGHSSCRMARFDTSAFIDAFRRRGVGRNAFGADDLRSWAGAIPSPRQGVLLTVSGILASPIFPEDLPVSGLVLDDATGALQVIHRAGDPLEVVGGALTGAGRRGPVEPESASGTTPAVAGPESLAYGTASPASEDRPTEPRTAESGTTDAGAGQGETPPSKPGDPSPGTGAPGSEHGRAPGTSGGPPAGERQFSPALMETIEEVFEEKAGAAMPGPVSEAVRGFVRTLASKAKWKDELLNLDRELNLYTNPLTKFRRLERLAREASADIREVGESFDHLKRIVMHNQQHVDLEGLVRAIQRLAGKI